jgi:branched-chain amino acid transport system substrate-binding protein
MGFSKTETGASAGGQDARAPNSGYLKKMANRYEIEVKELRISNLETGCRRSTSSSFIPQSAFRNPQFLRLEGPNKMKSFRIPAFLLLLIFAISCGDELKVYRIGAVLSLTGSSAAYGQNVKNGLLLAMNEINNQGGVHQKPIDLMIEDDQSNEKTAVQKTNGLIRNGGVPIIIGGVTSNIALAMAPVCESHKIILLSPTASAPKLSTAGEYIFRNYPSDTLEGKVMAEYAVRHMKIKNVAILSVDNDYGQGVTNVFKGRFTELGGAVIYEKSYPPDTSDFKEFVTEIGEDKPDAIYLPGYYNEIAGILKEISTQKVTAKIMSVEGVAQPMILEIAPDVTEGLVYPQPPYDPDSQIPAIQHFVQLYKSHYPTKPDIDVAFAYDAMHIAAKAIETSQNYPQDLKSRMQDTGYKGLTGDIAFDQNGDVNIEPRMFQIKEGKFTPLP